MEKTRKLLQSGDQELRKLGIVLFIEEMSMIQDYNYIRNYINDLPRSPDRANLYKNAQRKHLEILTRWKKSQEKTLSRCSKAQTQK